MEARRFVCPQTAIFQAVWFTLGVCSLPQVARAEAMDFYIYNQGNIQTVKNGDPNQIKPEYWVVWILYDRNAPPLPAGSKCGAEDAKTAGEAVDKARKFLDFNVRFAKWLAAPSNNWESYLDNCSGRGTFGPIAVMGEEVQWNRAKIPESLKEAWDVVETAKETWKQVKEVLDISDPRIGPKDENPYEHVGSVLKEYSKNLQQATLLLNQLTSKVLNGANLATLGDIVGKLNDAMAGLRDAKALALKELPALAPKPAPITPAPAQVAGPRCGTGTTRSPQQGRCVCENPSEELRDAGSGYYYCLPSLIVTVN